MSRVLSAHFFLFLAELCMRGKQPDIDIVWHNFPLTAPLWPSITKTADSSSSPSVQPPCDTQTFFQFKIWYWWSTASCCSHFEPCWGQYPYPYARCGHNSRHTISMQGSGRQFSIGRLLWLKRERVRDITFLFFCLTVLQTSFSCAFQPHLHQRSVLLSSVWVVRVYSISKILPNVYFFFPVHLDCWKQHSSCLCLKILSVSWEGILEFEDTVRVWNSQLLD